MLLFLAALLPCLAWDQDPAVPAQLGIDRICSSSQTDSKPIQKLPIPGVEYRMNEASASRSPWVDANGWRILRNPNARFAYDTPGEAASIAAAEAFAYGADASVHTDAKGAASYGALFAFLKQLKPAPLPPMANIGVVDDGSDVTGELMNLLARRNLLFKIVSAPDPGLDLYVRIGSREYPKSEASNPNMLAHKIRSDLTDDKRILRLYGSEVVIGHLTGDRTRARLHLIDYDKRPVRGLRVRVLGVYPKHELYVSGVPGAKLLDYTTGQGATEFTVAEMSRYAVVDLYASPR